MGVEARRTRPTFVSFACRSSLLKCSWRDARAQVVGTLKLLAIPFSKAGHDEILLRGLLVLNALGIVLYCVFFYLIWIVHGVKAQIANWVPPNNITHGALSISLLAAEMIAVRMVTPSSLLHAAIDVIWVVDALLFMVIVVTELWLVVSGVQPLLSFQVSNFARNFTYGMFFACTYYGYTHIEQSIIQSICSPWMLLVLAGVVFVVNIWEVSRQVIKYWKPELAFNANE